MRDLLIGLLTVTLQVSWALVSLVVLLLLADVETLGGYDLLTTLDKLLAPSVLLFIALYLLKE